MSRLSLLVCLAAVACATPTKPDTTHVADPGAPPAPLQPPARPTSAAEVRLQCNHVAAGYPDYAFNLVADTVDQCRVTQELSLKLKNGAHPDDGLTLHINPFHGAGEYNLDEPNLRALMLGARIPGGTAGLNTPKYSCSGCKVTVVDSTPSAPYPKPLGFVISCPNLCAEDTHVCTPAVSLNLEIPCTQ